MHLLKIEGVISFPRGCTNKMRTRDSALNMGPQIISLSMVLEICIADNTIDFLFGIFSYLFLGKLFFYSKKMITMSLILFCTTFSSNTL